MLEAGTQAPDFTLIGDDGKKYSLHDFRGKNVVIYFYPKDDTPGCTKEACDFRDNFSQLQQRDVQVFGISKDSVSSHQKFKEKYQLNFPLLADEKGEVCDAFGVFTKKMMFGKTFLGIERSTFLIDETGRIHKVWRKVKVDGHVTAVLKVLSTMTATSS